jgi:FKBP-type peptidyl-prolyl cis-trans isomerase FklB
MQTANPARAAGERFLDSVKADEQAQVFKMPSGLLFRVLSKGAGGKSPGPNDDCSVHYHGVLPDGAAPYRGVDAAVAAGKVFDSSYARGQPASFRPSQVIPGWTEALQLMAEGDVWLVCIPYQLAYGAGGAGGAIPGYAALVFQVELLRVKGAGKPRAEAAARLEAGLGAAGAALYAGIKDGPAVAPGAIVTAESAKGAGGGGGGPPVLQVVVGLVGVLAVLIYMSS